MQIFIKTALVITTKRNDILKIVSIVPIKLNNERLPQKNTKLLGDKPLINYICDTLLSVDMIDGRFVYCSSKEICKYTPNGIIFLKRPEYLDLPTSNFTQIFSEFSNVVNADIYIYAHATAPFIKKETIVSAVKAVASGEYDSAFCAQRLQDFIWSNGEPLNFSAENLPRSQDLPVYYRETSGVYVFTKKVFEKYKRRIGINPFIVEVGYKEAVDVNTFEDFKLAEHFITYKEDDTGV